MTTVPNKVQALSGRKNLPSKVLANEHRQHLLSKVILCLPHAKTATALASVPTDRIFTERVDTTCKTRGM